ncbi:hypothetical protein D3C81_2191270 [compost metagenome]
MVLHALEAILTSIARPARRDSHLIANSQTTHTIPQSCDGSRHFMTEYHRFAQANGTDTAMVIIVEVGTTNPTCLNGNLNLT